MAQLAADIREARTTYRRIHEAWALALRIKYDTIDPIADSTFLDLRIERLSERKDNAYADLAYLVGERNIRSADNY